LPDVVKLPDEDLAFDSEYLKFTLQIAVSPASVTELISEIPEQELQLRRKYEEDKSWKDGVSNKYPD
jgi:hypothetical protein